MTLPRSSPNAADDGLRSGTHERGQYHQLLVSIVMEARSSRAIEDCYNACTYVVDEFAVLPASQSCVPTSSCNPRPIAKTTCISRLRAWASPLRERQPK